MIDHAGGCRRRRLPGFWRAALLCSALLLTLRQSPAQETEALTPAPPSTATTLVRQAEGRLAQGDRFGAATAYREALLQWAPHPRSALAGFLPEVELAIVRLAKLRFQNGDSSVDRDVLSAWAERTDTPLLAATARRQLGFVLLSSEPHSADRLQRVRELWKPLFYLDQFQLIGPFDNEQGGGFQTKYGPEAQIDSAPLDLDATYDGKTRPVRWRSLPGRPLAGNINLGALFEPNEEALAYALTFVRSDRARGAALRFGTKNGYRIWINGAEVASADLRRPFRRDQNAVAVQLRTGWNSVLFKLPQSKGDWRFAVRLTQPDGGPLTGVEEGRPPANTKVAAAVEPTDPPQLALGSIGRLAARAGDAANGASAAAPLGARDSYLLGSLLLEGHPHDENDHPDTRALRRATQLEPGRPLYFLDLARSRRRTTQIAAQQEENAWRHDMETAYALESSVAALKLARHYHGQFANKERAAELLRTALRWNPANEQAILLRGQVEADFQFPLSRFKTRLRLQALEKRSVRAQLRLARAAAGRGRLHTTIQSLEKLLNQNQLNNAVRQALVEFYLTADRVNSALQLLERGAELFPLLAYWPLETARIHEARDQFPMAVDAVDQALAILHEDASLHERRGKLLLRTGDRDAALISFDEALRLQPNSPSLREYVEFLRNSKEEFEGEFRRNVEPLIAQARANSRSEEDAPARILLELTAVDLNQDGTTKTFSQNLIEILNDRGIRDYDSFATHYARGEQVVEFKKARVHHTDGSVSDAELRRFSSPGSEQRDYASASVDLPPLSQGDIVEIEFVREDLRQSFFGDYYGHREVFQKSMPIREKAFVLRAPKGRELNFHQRNLTIERTEKVDDHSATITYSWTAHHLSKLEPEPGMPLQIEVSPLLEISSFKDWNAFNNWYWNLIRKQFESSSEIRRKVHELTSGIEDDLGKVRAIYNFIVTDIRYNMWEFGVHGFKPYNAANIFARKFGDCKDKSTLASVMLKEVGIDAYPVLIYGTRQRSEEDLSLPLVNHFNHCITYVPQRGDSLTEGIFLDGTAKYHSLDELPSMDRGARVLIVKPDGGELDTVEWNRPEDFFSLEETTIEIDEDLSASYNTRLRLAGDYAVFARELFEIKARRKTELERIFSRRFAACTVEDNEFSAVDNLNTPVSFAVDLKIPRFVVESPEGLALRPEKDFFSTSAQLASLGGLEERQFDVVLGNPRRSQLKTVYHLPKGLQVKSLPKTQDMQNSFGRLHIEYRTDGEGRVIVDRTIEVTEPRVPTSSYALFREFAAALKRLDDARILLERA